MFPPNQIHSDIRDRNFESKEQEIESAEKSVLVQVLILVGCFLLIGTVIMIIILVAPQLPDGVLGPIVVGILVVSLLGGTGYGLWRLARK
jgi:hypothetical protein